MSARIAILGWIAAIGLVIATAGLTILNARTALPVAAIALRGSVPPVMALFGLLNCTLGAFLMTRRPGNRLGWLLFAGGLAVCGEVLAFEYAVFGLRTAPGMVPAASIAAAGASVLIVPVGLIIVMLPPLLFPDGRLASPVWRLPWVAALAAVLIIGFGAAIMPGPFLLAPFAVNPFGAAGGRDLALGAISVGSALGGATLIFGLAAVSARFRRGTLEQRQQLKWFIFAAAATAVFDQLLFFVPQAGATEAGIDATIIIGALPPVAMTIAILRYRLYAIDVLIRRTIIYAATTAALGAVFFAVVLVVQTLLRPFTSGNELAVAASTLATVGLFHPLRSRIRSGVDRRFYRASYDGAVVLDLFATRLASEVDLDAVRALLLDSVDRTVRPANASIWLRPKSP